MKKLLLSGLSQYEELGFSLDYVTPQKDYLLHTHDFSELEIILSGTAVNSINGKSFSVEAGDVFVVEQGATHEITQVRGLTLYNIGFRQSALRSLGADLLELPGFHALFLSRPELDPGVRQLHLKEEELNKVRHLLEEMRQEYLGGEPGFRTALLCGFSRLLLMLSRNYSQQTPTGGIWQAAAAAARMEREFGEEMSVRGLAESVYLSERHFRRLFEKVYGVSPSDYLLELRLRTAGRLLISESASVTEVAMACGFSDGNYFSRVFRRKYGMPPTAYRALRGKNQT